MKKPIKKKGLVSKLLDERSTINNADLGASDMTETDRNRVFAERVRQWRQAEFGNRSFDERLMQWRQAEFARNIKTVALIAELVRDQPGIVAPLSDIAYWLDAEPEVKQYVDLLREINQTKDPLLLLPLLNVPDAAKPYFQDLFERLEFKSRSKRTPKYQRSVQQLKLLLAVKWVRDRPRGETVEQAITRVAATMGLDYDTLRKAYLGQHTSLRRAGR